MSLSQDLVDLAVALKGASDARMDAALARIAAQWGVAWQELADEWMAALTELTADTDKWPSRATILRSERALQALEHTAQRLQELVEENVATTTGSLPDLLDLARNQQIRLIGAQFPAEYAASWSATPVATKALDAIVARTTGQITALSQPIPDDVTAVIKSTLIKGVALGENPRRVAADMVSRIGDRFDLGRARAENVARTELIDAHRNAALETRKANTDVLQGWMWTAYLGPRTCLSCVSMHGAVFDNDEPGPYDHQSGRCVATPVTKTWRELGIDLDEPEGMERQTGAAWLQSQPESVQRQVMGPKRYDAWRAGDFPPDQWAVRKENPDWRDSYVPGTPG